MPGLGWLLRSLLQTSRPHGILRLPASTHGISRAAPVIFSALSSYKRCRDRGRASNPLDAVVVSQGGELLTTRRRQKEKLMVLQFPLPLSLGKENAFEHPHSNAQCNLFQVEYHPPSQRWAEAGKSRWFYRLCFRADARPRRGFAESFIKGKAHRNLHGVGVARGNWPLNCYRHYHPELLANKIAKISSTFNIRLLWRASVRFFSHPPNPAPLKLPCSCANQCHHLL